MIRLENDALILEVGTVGAAWTRIYDKRKKSELLFAGEKDSWKDQAPLLFPIVGRLQDGEYTHRGMRYALGTHGFLRHEELIVEAQTEDKVTFLLESTEETKKVYPFSFRYRVTYALAGARIEGTICVENLSDERMPFSAGAHPGFAMKPDQKDVLVRFVPANAKTQQAIYHGTTISEWRDITVSEYTGDQIPWNDTLVVRPMASVVVKSPTFSIRMTMDPVHTMALWAPIRKSTNTYERCLCIEPWWGESDHTDTDHELFHKSGSYILEPGEEKILRYTFDIE